jgi:hypothetical protein
MGMIESMSRTANCYDNATIPRPTSNRQLASNAASLIL